MASQKLMRIGFDVVADLSNVAEQVAVEPLGVTRAEATPAVRPARVPVARTPLNTNLSRGVFMPSI
jgi:hypothetical protein